MDRTKFENLKESVKDFGRKAKTEVCDKAVRFGNWAVRNREMIVIAVPIAVAGLKAGQTHLVNKRMKDERDRIDMTYYDPSTGFHWQLRRKATNADRAEISKRKKEGMETYDILQQLKLIK